MITVFVADDQELVRDGLRTIVSAQPDMTVVGESADGSEAIRGVRELRPDVVLMDVRMPVVDGIEATRQLTAGGDVASRILMLTTFDLDEHVYDALKAGASGFLLKDVPKRQLLEAIRTVAEGDALLAPAVTRRLVEDFLDAPRPISDDAALARLTEREREVLEQVARGRSNSEIAAAMFVTESTVKTHVGNVLGKLGLRDRVQIVVYAYEHRIVRPGR